MNAMLTSTLPLPSCLHEGACALHRRHRVGTLDVTDDAIDRFNRLLGRVGRTAMQLDGDRIATAARQLCGSTVTLQPPACIRQRLLLVKAATAMVADSAWRAPDEAAATIRVVAEYVASNDDLIPDAVPGVGRLDDAILIDVAWPSISQEVMGYLDFRRLRRFETERGEMRVRFDRAAWSEARCVEAALRAHRETVRNASFVPAPVARFLVH
jgi:uncharacterized membrane protein YkvA (DUF1232 family)